MVKSVDDFLKDFEAQEVQESVVDNNGKESLEEKVTKKTKGEQKTTYKSLVKTDREYKGHPVYEIEFSNGLKILGVNIDGHLMELKPKERLYKDVVNDSLAEWMSDSATKTRNRWWQSYWDKNGFPEVNR